MSAAKTRGPVAFGAAFCNSGEDRAFLFVRPPVSTSLSTLSMPARRRRLPEAHPAHAGAAPPLADASWETCVPENTRVLSCNTGTREEPAVSKHCPIPQPWRGRTGNPWRSESSLVPASSRPWMGTQSDALGPGRVPDPEGPKGAQRRCRGTRWRRFLALVLHSPSSTVPDVPVNALTHGLHQI